MAYHNDGFVRVGAATPRIKVADCEANRESVRRLMEEAAGAGVQAMVFPELCLTGYTCGDLFQSGTLLAGAEQALRRLLQETEGLNLVAAVGLPVAVGGELYNCAAVLCRGRLLGLAAKSNIPNYGEFYEARHFSAAPGYLEVCFAGQRAPLGNSLLFRCEEMPELVLGVEICEDLWVPCPPDVRLTAGGATLMLNLSASDEIAGKAEYRRGLVQGQSARTLCAYAYADAGEGESSTDLVFAGHNVIAENGALLAESQPFGTGLITADADLERMLAERRRTTTWRNARAPEPFGPTHEVVFSMPVERLELRRKIEPLAFVPRDAQHLEARCETILNLQAAGLRTRLAHTGAKNAVVGVSGGLDSTLALLVTARAFDALGLSRAGILAVSMPGFGTTMRTKSNAQRLAGLLDAQFRETPIGASVLQHFRDIGQDPENHDVTYENAQARERTQVLMDLANQNGGLVIGTGDLSELALGWATYNGDHMSMYAVNASIPKTLVRHLVAHAARRARQDGAAGGEELGAVLEDILNTPVSPELLPPEEGEIAQRTEDIVGPYELHDFFLYNFIRGGYRPAKILFLAEQAFRGSYDHAAIRKWLEVFFRRFFSQQFKRSAMPDGPKVGSVALSPRGDWRMPSDASAAVWLKELETL